MEKTFEWIRSAIQSSTTPFHLECCEVLVGLFAAKYQPSGEDEYNILLEDIRNKKVYFSVDA